MRLYDIPEVSLVELHFEYMGEFHKVKTILVYNLNQIVYVSAIKSAGHVIPAVKLKNVSLIYRTELGVYVFRKLLPKSIFYNGQNLYALSSEEDVVPKNNRKNLRLHVGVSISAKIYTTDGRVSNVQGILKDISMTGMSIIINRKLDRTAKIEISFSVNREKISKLMAHIIHMNEFTTGSGYIYGCEFDIPNETIGRYVVKKYIEMDRRQKGNL